MNESLGLNQIELKEMARVLLCEIYSAEKAQGVITDSGYAEEASGAENRFFGGIENFDRRYAGFGDIGGFQRQFGALGGGMESSPRLSRRDFLEQRNERLKQRELLLKSTVGDETQTESSGIRQSGNLTQEDLSEKLSERFCRDARRYDGAFERY